MGGYLVSAIIPSRRLTLTASRRPLLDPQRGEI